MFIASMLIFGTVGVLRRYIPLSSAALAFSRGVLGGLFLLAVVLLRKKKGEKTPARAFLSFVFIGALIGVNWMLLFEAYSHATVAVATLCYYMEPTVVMLLSPLFFKEKLTPKKAVCAALALFGMVLVSGVPGGERGGSVKGVLFGLSAALVYSAVVIFNKKAPQAEVFKRTTVMLFSAGAVMLPYTLLTGGFETWDISGTSVLLIIILGIVHTGIAYTLYFAGMRNMKVQTVALLSYIDPVTALLLSALLLKEPMSVYGALGAVLIIGSAMVSELKARNNKS
ncbi:MAG: EamA family transporter [Clostridia bacterium]|nr:EamA family transporter [Clostridia bacterium]